MKSKLKSIISTFFILLLVLNYSCNEDDFLDEEPLDFYSPENSYVTYSNFEAALTDLYAKVRDIYALNLNASEDVDYLGTDICYDARLSSSRIGNYTNSFSPQSSLPENQWNKWYKIIANVNTIISRLPASELTDSEKSEVQAEAKLFRAWSYRHLVYYFGGVPLILDEVTSPKTDYIRESRETILNQIISDATEAAANLKDITEVKDGKLSSAVANHLLAETYITLGEYDKAITAASVVIDNSAISLMTERFGTMASVDGDVYFDLFRVDNQNRGTGNTEAIWVAQYELDVIGGGMSSTAMEGNMLERCVVPVTKSLKDPDGEAGMFRSADRSDFNIGGRGVSFIRPTYYYLYQIWGLDPDADNRIVTSPDIRTSIYNIQRDAIYSNPESNYFGKSIIDFPSPTKTGQDWRWYPWPTKVTTGGQHPESIIDDPEYLTLKSTAGATYRDCYIIRLAETYLLRAEAYLMNNETQKAADDINVVRNRSNATLVTAGEVDLDYILDERARELTFEERRRVTLARMGKLVERVRLYNPLNGPQILDYHSLMPIPYAEIEANKDGKLEQNPGYTN